MYGGESSNSKRILNTKGVILTIKDRNSFQDKKKKTGSMIILAQVIGNTSHIYMYESLFWRYFSIIWTEQVI